MRNFPWFSELPITPYHQVAGTSRSRVFQYLIFLYFTVKFEVPMAVRMTMFIASTLNTEAVSFFEIYIYISTILHGVKTQNKNIVKYSCTSPILLHKKSNVQLRLHQSRLLDTKLDPFTYHPRNVTTPLLFTTLSPLFYQDHPSTRGQRDPQPKFCMHFWRIQYSCIISPYKPSSIPVSTTNRLNNLVRTENGSGHYN